MGTDPGANIPPEGAVKQLVDDCVVSVSARPGSRRADVRTVGRVDTAAAPLLTDAVDRLSEGAPRSVFIDLAGITVAGPALANLLIQAHSRLSRGSCPVICRPTPAVVSVLVAGGVVDMVNVCENLIV